MANHEWAERTGDVGTHAPVAAPEARAAVLSVGVMIAPWSLPTAGRGWQGLLAVVAVALVALLQFVWLYHARSARRWSSALDTYAAREIARARRRKAPPT